MLLIYCLMFFTQVMNVLLGVLDDGRLTDAKGRTVSFANTVIIMTSNLGSDLLLEHGNSALAKELVMGVVKQHFRPEFLNRLDDVVMFEPLGHEQLRQIARMQVSILEKCLVQYFCYMHGFYPFMHPMADEQHVLSAACPA